MSLALDHLAITAATLEEGVAFAEAALGLSMGPGGKHGAMGTHNRLVRLGDIYLEVITIDPGAPDPERPRWFGLDERSNEAPQLSTWILRSDDLEGDLKRLGPAVGAPLALSRGALSWRMAVPVEGSLPMDGVHPALMAWNGPSALENMEDSGAELMRLVVRHPDAQTLEGRLALSDPRVDFEVASQVGLAAEIMTPNGLRRL